MDGAQTKYRRWGKLRQEHASFFFKVVKGLNVVELIKFDLQIFELLVYTETTNVILIIHVLFPPPRRRSGRLAGLLMNSFSDK